MRAVVSPKAIISHSSTQASPQKFSLRTQVLVTPGLSKTGLLREILAELGIALPVGIGQVHDLVRLLSNHIIQLHQEGRRLIVIIDEAHLLSADCLHVVRTISNIETPEQKLSTCLLLGESRLAQRLEHPTFESLRNRIYLRCTLDPLTVEETEQYIKFRLLTAGRPELVIYVENAGNGTGGTEKVPYPNASTEVFAPSGQFIGQQLQASGVVTVNNS